MEWSEKMDEAVVAIVAIIPDCSPETAIILGTGLGSLIGILENPVKIPYERIPHLVSPTVMNHEGTLWYGTISGKKVILFQGRFHFYEGYSLQEISFPVRIAQGLGCKNLIITNVAGALNTQFRAGELVAITDHINLLGTSPLVGSNEEKLGSRFPDMIEPYSERFLDTIRTIALEEKVLLHRGVYACVSGPQLETRAEYRMLNILGADMVGMSTVPEVITAVHAGLAVLGITVLTDECFPDALTPVSIPAIMAYAQSAESKLVTLVSRFIERS